MKAELTKAKIALYLLSLNINNECPLESEKVINLIFGIPHVCLNLNMLAVCITRNDS